MHIDDSDEREPIVMDDESANRPPEVNAIEPVNVRVVIEEIPQGTPEYDEAVHAYFNPVRPQIGQQLSAYRNAKPLEQFRQSFGGAFIGQMPFPLTGEKHTVDLRRWKDTDPEKTFVAVSWHYEDASKPSSYRPAGAP